MKSIKHIKRTYLKWFIALNFGLVIALFSMNLIYNHILDKDLWNTSRYTVLSVVAIYTLAAAYYFLLFNSKRKWGILLFLAILVFLFYSTRAVIFEIFPQWDNELYNVGQQPDMKAYVMIMLPRLFYYSFIAIAIVLNLRIGMLLLRTMRAEMEKIAAIQQAKEMELRAWGAYTNPHLFHNELNGIANELADEDYPEKRQYVARRLTLLAEISKYNTENVRYDRRIVVIKRELEQLENYLESRDVGRPGYVRPVVDVIGAVKAQKIVPMTLVYLAEGAFKHGDLVHEPLAIRVELQDAQIGITFKNRISTASRAKESLGSGLDVIRRRLELAIPGRFSFEAGAKGAYFEAVIIINQS